MSESSGKYKLAVGNNQMSRGDSKQMLRDIHKSLRHLNVRGELMTSNHHQESSEEQHQQQLMFEQQLALESNIKSLSESVAGERRSYPRATKQFAIEEIRKPTQWRNGVVPGGGGNGNDLNKMDHGHHAFKSSSFSDLSRVGLDAILMQQQQHKHEGEPHREADSMADFLHPVNVHKNVNTNSHTTRVTQTQRLFGQAPHITRSTSNLYNPQVTSSRQNQLAPSSNRTGGAGGMYYMKHNGGHDGSHRAMHQGAPLTPPRQYSADRGSNYDPPHSSQLSQLSTGSNFSESRPSSLYGNPQADIHEIETVSPRKISTDSHRVQRSHYEDVTLRQKSSDRKIPPQNRWSAEVYALPYDFSKPPPPYPGFAKGLKRGGGGLVANDVGDVEVANNTPITVIFDKEGVNVVGGIPEGYENIHSASSSSGQSSPRHSQQMEPPVYNFPAPPHPVPSQPPPPPTSQQIFNPPPPLLDINFVPIKDPPRRERGCPPPYPGRGHSNRNSINIEEMELSGGGSRDFHLQQQNYSTDSGNCSKRTSTATESGSFNQSESSASGSPTPPDGVERSYSPLPISSTTMSTSSSSESISTQQQSVVQTRQEKEKEVGTGSGERRLKNCHPQAYKFFMEQHVENLLKLQEQRKHRRSQLEAEMARVGLAEQAQEEMRKLLNKKESNYIRLRRAKMDISMFTKIVTVGVGAFGEVNLVRKNGTNAYYAMKILRKSEVLRRNQVAHVKAERDILAEADVQWVVKLYYSFQNEHNLYFVMDYIPGGDLMALLIKQGIFQQKLAQFYTAELTLAIESVHKLGFIHRDIKPDNVLIDSNGHIKLTDFGLCTGFHWTHDSKYYQPKTEGEGHSRQFSMEPEGGWESLLNDVGCDCKQLKLQHDLYKPLKRRQLRRHTRCQAHSLVGTPNYIAPEVLMRVPYSQQCDWWSLGVILYEMLVGQPPFLAPTPAETQLKVINWTQTLTIPKVQLSKEARDLIKKLCTHPDERLGKGGADDIKRHPYFKGVNFKEIHTQQAPYTPIIKHATDTSNFDPVPEHMSTDFNSPENAPVEVSSGVKDGPEYAFYEFTFRHFFDDGGIANPNFELSNSEKPKALSHSKRPITSSNKSVAVPNKVPAPSSISEPPEEKTPIYV